MGVLLILPYFVFAAGRYAARYFEVDRTGNMAKLAGLAVAHGLRREKIGAAHRGPLHQVPPWVLGAG